jgi:hypothetical protein
VLPYDELPIMKWNGNPYRLDGGNGGRSEDDGAYFLLPYWMGRYHKLLDSAYPPSGATTTVKPIAGTT